MSDPAGPDPWDSLAETLGAKPIQPAPETPPSRPAPTSGSRPQSSARRPGPAPAPAAPMPDWDSLAAELGVAGGGDSPRPATPAPRPERRPEPPARADDRRTERRADRDSGRSFDDSTEKRPLRPAADGAPRTEDGDQEPRQPARSDSEGGNADDEGRGRRRRGRRGGRGRRRGGDRADSPAEREPRASDEFAPDADSDRAPPRQRSDDTRPVRRPAAASDNGDAREASGNGREASGDDDRGDRFDETGGDRPRAEADRVNGDEQPRKRRRRGRRGGRSRSREGAETGERRPSDRRQPATNLADDEPLPASYGSRAADHPDQEADPATRTAPRSDESTEEGRPRRRRRRSRKDGTPAAAPRESQSGRRTSSSRGQPDRPRRTSDSRPARERGRQADFAPVSGRYDEDDEGLEFLGVEEAARESEGRVRRGDEDDVLEESGLSTVLDVPSWVEAIGIVIAGNLAARTKSGRGGGPGR
jgi:hypothetical protein